MESAEHSTTLSSSPLVYCSGHGANLERAQFYAASLRAGESRCKRCNGRARHARRKRDPLRRLQWRMYQAELRRSPQGAFSSAEAVRALGERYEWRSAIPAADDNDDDDDDNEKELCVVRFYADLPLHAHPWNAVPVTMAQARHLPRAGEAKRREAHFPPALCADMARSRANEVRH